MQNLKYLLVAAAIGSCLSLSQTSASPLVAGLSETGSAAAEITSGVVEKVSHRRYYRHKRHYRHRYRNPHRRYYRHRYRRYYDDDYYYPSYGYYPYYYRRPYYPYAYPYGGPVITFGFGF